MLDQIRYSFMVHIHDRRLRLVGILLIVALLGLCGVISFLVSSGYNGSAIEDVSYSYMYSFSGRVGYVFPLIVSALVVSSEFRSGQIARSIIGYGSRTRAFLASTVSGTTIGFFSGIVLLTAAYGITSAMVVISGHRLELFENNYFPMYLRTVLLMALWAWLGAGLAWLFKNQTVVIAGVLAFAVFIEPTVSAAGNASDTVMSIVRWLPGPLNWSIAWPTTVGSGEIQRAIGLEWWQSGAIMLFYAVALAAVTYVFGCKWRDFPPSASK